MNHRSACYLGKDKNTVLHGIFQIRTENMKWLSTSDRYTYCGILFGFLFPIISTVFETFLQLGQISFIEMMQIQEDHPLLWVIDSAPLFLGLTARLAGKKQEAAEKMNERLKELNKELNLEIIKNRTIENNLRDMISTYKEDLNSAKIVQEFMLPEIPVIPECKISYKYQPLNPVGGDLLSIIPLEEGGLSILIGDVVGHGISAALIASLVKVFSNKNCRHYGTQPKLYMEQLNKEAGNYLPNDYFFTALYGFLKFEENYAKFIYSRAGHPYPFIFSHHDKTTRTIEVSGSPLGLIKNLHYNETETPVFKKDRIFLITDGLLEIKSKSGKFIGSDGFIAIINEVCSQDLPLNDTVEKILLKVEEEGMNAPAEDDRLILGIEIC